MPFNAPFRQKIHPNDLIYGLKDQRINYTKEFPEFKLLELEMSKYRVRPRIIDEYVIPVDAEMRSDGQERKNRMTLGRKQRFQSNFMSYLSQHPKYYTTQKSLADIKKEEEREKTNVDIMSQFGRKCKGGLSWITRNDDEMTKDMHVHFILDKIDMEYIVQKKEYPGSRGSSDITARELRWIYRNRHFFRVQQKIQFWLNGKPTTPPWESKEGEALWNQYIPQNEPF
ncbi:MULTISPECIES: hypothetical protein [Xenorhabdus]|uniref:Uncharacterized protein n=1 Tax=Xenorhabdus ehlersii TaxID=290111 RepID=A0A2D0ISJ1_9GAMM|nr:MULTISPECIES: hypothetical protein [Xenorhabdus]MBC8948207.1 hypothetical protein [Xenorhabdus sp. TS4]PHM24837.1 hypothetical protein Xehl_01611 [Xenorhabdus ehlersii]RKE88067.1 hypothetical protein BDE27_3626 [Xenorhabdus ehlersii]